MIVRRGFVVAKSNMVFSEQSEESCVAMADDNCPDVRDLIPVTRRLVRAGTHAPRHTARQ